VLTDTKNQFVDLSGDNIEVIPVAINRSAKNPFKDFMTMYQIWWKLMSIKPDIVHCVSLKVILLNFLPSLFAGTQVVVNAVTGLGYLFSEDRKARALLKYITPILRYALAGNNKWTILQNTNDQQLLISKELINPERSCLISGAGIDVEEYKLTAEHTIEISVILPARVLWDKGVGEFVEAARIIRSKNENVRMILVGELDLHNPAAVSQELIDSWVAEGCVEWWGYQEDMQSVYSQADIVCLPSYREGFSKVLLEAAASARGLIATDVPGCREIVVHEKTGIQVPVKDHAALAEAILKLANDRKEITRLGLNARKYVQENYSMEYVIDKTLSFYEKALSRVD